MPKIAFQKVASSHLPILPVFYHCTAKSKEIALKLWMCVVCMVFTTFNLVWNDIKIVHFMGIETIYFLGSKYSNIKNLT